MRSEGVASGAGLGCSSTRGLRGSFLCSSARSIRSDTVRVDVAIVAELWEHGSNIEP